MTAAGRVRSNASSRKADLQTRAIDPKPS